jgi:hypothetical protein
MKITDEFILGLDVLHTEFKRKILSLDLLYLLIRPIGAICVSVTVSEVLQLHLCCACPVLWAATLCVVWRTDIVFTSHVSWNLGIVILLLPLKSDLVLAL